LKIVAVGPAFPLRGGISNFNETLSSALIEHGHQVVNVSFSMQYPKLLFPGKTQYDQGLKPVNLEIEPLINSINPLSWKKTANHIINLAPDIVIFYFWIPFLGPCMGKIARLIKRKLPEVPVLGILHNVIPHERRPGDFILTRYFLRSCEGFIAMSNSVVDDLKRFIPGPRVEYIPHPLYNIYGDPLPKREAKEYLKIDPEEPMLLFFGIIRPYKGLDLLLEAMAMPKVKEQGVRLMVAGEFYEDKSRYEAMVKNLGLENIVMFTNQFVPTHEVKYFFSAADIVVQPYRSATQSGVTQIAYHFNRPMLVTDVGGLSEMVPHMEVGYVTPTKPEDIANCLADFYQNDREQEFVANIEKEKEKYSWDNMIHGIEQYMEAK
jgi:glycosyltransferase involved in cell wall biosynthesis